MKNKLSIFLIALSLVALLVLQIPSQVIAEVSEPAVGVELGKGAVITAEVVGIDYKDRVLMLSGPEGNVVHLEVSEAARNFDQIQVGDQVKAEYYGSVALYLGNHGLKPAVNGGVVTGRSAKGDRPAGVAVETIDVSAMVKAIDREKRAVTLELPDGSVVTTQVDPSVKAFDTLEVGNSIHARYTEAIATSVEKP